jgi:hypothetical protein
MIHAIPRLFDKGWKGQVADPEGSREEEGRAFTAPPEPQELSEAGGLRSKGRVPEETQGQTLNFTNFHHSFPTRD